MDEINPRLIEIFYDIHSGLPRQGVGDNESTKKALSLCTELPEKPDVLDIGCGPGMQTIALAKVSKAKIAAVDNYDEYLDQLRQRVKAEALEDRVVVKQADMMALEFAENSFDLIWCEGAIYIRGVAEALTNWRPLLRDGGYIAFSELLWLDKQPSGEVLEFFNSEYPAMSNAETIRELIQQSGFKVVGDFNLPDSSWWNDYYTPLEAKLPSLKQKYQGDEEALAVIAMTEAEIDIRRRFASSYGYKFFVARKAG